MQKECTKWEWLQEPLHPTEPICKREMHTALTPSLFHAEMPTQLDHSCFPVCAFYWGTIIAGKLWHFSQLQFVIFSAFISTEADKVKNFPFQSLHFFALTQIVVCWWKDNSFLCLCPAPRASIQIRAILSEGNTERTEKLWCNMKWSDFQRRSRPPPAVLFHCCWAVHQAANLYQQQ